MNLSFLPQNLLNAINKIDINFLYQIRLRRNYPVTAIYDNNYVFLTESGISINKKNSIICESGFIKEIINNITESSIYAYNDKIKQGFITTDDGIRIGLAGECVYTGENVQTIKNINSVLIRIPHFIEGCSKKILPYIYNKNNIYNSLIISPPMFGKTTLLKDIAININKTLNKSILIIDERGEFNEIEGVNIDKIKYSDKLYAFNFGIRSLSPEIIITDELSTKNDWTCALNASNSGVNIVASCHAKSILDVKNKDFFIKNVFDRYFILKVNDKIGTLSEVYNKDFEKI